MKNLFILVTLCFFSSCYFVKALKYKKYKLESLSDFPAISYEKSTHPFQFYRGTLPEIEKKNLDSMLTGSNKYAFVIIRNDSILYEFYNQNIADSTMLPSFSVAKSFVSTMVAMAHEEGKIKSLQESITNYLPELKKRDSRFEKIKIQHVLDMRSGIKSSENYYNPLSDVLRLGFGKNIQKKALRIDIESEPNLSFEYKSINTQLLAMIVERATGKKLQDYYREKIHQPLQMQYSASWIYDDPKHQELRAFCCMNLAALDYAKFGKLFLDKGQWDGRQLVSREWVEATTNPDTMRAYGGYKNQWWAWEPPLYVDSASLEKYQSDFKSDILRIGESIEMNNKKFYKVYHKSKCYYARGLLNQYIIVHPDKNMIFIHFGNSQNASNPLKKGFDSYLRNWTK